MSALDLTEPGSRSGPLPAAAPTDSATVPSSAVSDLRIGGALLIAGTALMVSGVVTQETSGASLFAAMEAVDPADIASELSAVADVRGRIVTGLALWMAGAPCLSLGGVLLARLAPRSLLADVVRWAAAASTGAALLFFSVMIGMAVGLAPASAAGVDVAAEARALGVAATTADWVVTALVLSGAVAAAIVAGRRLWAPRWLVGLALLTAIGGALSVVAFAAGRPGIAFVEVPLGLGTALAAGVTALRRSAGLARIGVDR